jgi:Domain of unknown function (DUF6894)
MAQIYFHCCNPEHIFVDRDGVDVSDMDEAFDHAACFVRSLIAAPSSEDWRSWVLRVSDDLDEEIFVVPFETMLGKPH